MILPSSCSSRMASSSTSNASVRSGKSGSLPASTRLCCRGLSPAGITSFTIGAAFGFQGASWTSQAAAQRYFFASLRAMSSTAALLNPESEAIVEHRTEGPSLCRRSSAPDTNNLDNFQSRDGLGCCRASHAREGEAAQTVQTLNLGVKPVYHGRPLQVPLPDVRLCARPLACWT